MRSEARRIGRERYAPADLVDPVFVDRMRCCPCQELAGLLYRDSGHRRNAGFGTDLGIRGQQGILSATRVYGSGYTDALHDAFLSQRNSQLYEFAACLSSRVMMTLVLAVWCKLAAMMSNPTTIKSEPREALDTYKCNTVRNTARALNLLADDDAVGPWIQKTWPSSRL